MPGGSTATRGNELFSQMLYLPSITVPSVTTLITVTQTYTVNGVQVGDLLSWNIQGAGVSGLAITNMWVSAVNTISAYWYNGTAGTLGGTTANLLLEVTRPENVVDGGVTVLPSTIF